MTGCFDKNNLKNAKVTTTVYPIEYLIQRLMVGNDIKITSIYPNGTILKQQIFLYITDYHKKKK